jgi:hypothetical protein
MLREKDRETLVWAHGFLSGLINRIEARLPELMNVPTLLQRSEAEVERLRHELRKIRLEEKEKAVRRRMAEELRRFDSTTSRRLDEDSLDAIERGLADDEIGDASVPARRKPGPRGLQGGAAIPLPPPEQTDIPM